MPELKHQRKLQAQTHHVPITATRGRNAVAAFEDTGVFDAARPLSNEGTAVLAAMLSKLRNIKPTTLGKSGPEGELIITGIHFRRSDVNAETAFFVILEYNHDLRLSLPLSGFLIDNEFDLDIIDNYLIVDGVRFYIERNKDIVICNIVNDKTAKSTEVEAAPPLPRPDLPRWAEENRPTKLVRVRFDPSLVDAMQRAAANSDQTLSDWLRDAATAHLPEQLKPKP